MRDEVIVESSSLRYGLGAFGEGLVEKYSQSFGDAERSTRVVHGTLERE